MSAAESPVKVVVDTDTGVDDGMGLIYAILSPELDVVGVTTSFGNVDVDRVTRNTAVIMERLGLRVPLAKGAARGIGGSEPIFNPEIHGEDGFGDAHLPDPDFRDLVDLSAAQLTIDLADRYPGELTWIGLGPITNLALALLLDPELPRKLPRVVWMGGAVSVPGNETPVAEADAKHDPEALALCIAQEWDFLQIGLDVTDHTIFEEEHLAAVRASRSPAAELIAAAVPSYMSFYEQIIGRYSCAMHSPLTVAVVAHPELITYEETIPMHVELTGTMTRGMTVGDRRRGQKSEARRWDRSVPTVRVAFEVDRPTFLRRYVERVTA